jgi:hypothetical protein
LAEGEELSAEAVADNLALLNEILHGWVAKGIMASHVDLALVDDVVVPDTHRLGLRLILAKHIANEFGSGADADLVQDVRNWEAVLHSMIAEAPEVPVDPMLRRMESNYPYR